MKETEFYECTECHAPFFGGYVDCGGDLQPERNDLNEPDE